KKVYLCAVMGKGNRHIAKKWVLLTLFASYVITISLFTHTHVVNRVTYVHSHPFKKGEKAQHTHTENQLFLLAHFYHTPITSDIIPDFDLSGLSKSSFINYTILYEGLHPVKNQTPTLLRAPPAA
ncbi:MAG TPA: hypothetical protein DC016_05615, partial [Porphyromonadaceae bacterium]|nr:hypothetical protein [Porphyromonadaceae bacterium]